MCRRASRRTSDGWVVNGQKVWTSLAHDAAFGILLARTNPDVPKHQGLSYFLIDMKTPGVEVRPLVEMTGDHLFNEVFFTDVHIPADALIGEEGNGWAMARDTLDNERVTLSRAGLQWGWGPTAEDLVEVARERGGVPDPVLRMRLVDAYIEHEIIRIHGLRMVAAAVSGRPGPEASLRKALSDPHGQKTFILSKDLAGAQGMLHEQRPPGHEPGVVGARIPLRAGTHRRRRDLRSAPQRHRRTDARSSARARRRRRQALGGDAQSQSSCLSPAVLYEVDGHVATVTFNRPDARNAVNPEVIVRLADAWDAIDGDDNVRVAILTGAGGHFCAGADLDKLVGKLMAGGEPADEFEARIQEDYSIIYKGFLRNHRLAKPLIAAIEGFCLAGGGELSAVLRHPRRRRERRARHHRGQVGALPDRRIDRASQAADPVHEGDGDAADGRTLPGTRSADRSDLSDT